MKLCSEKGCAPYCDFCQYFARDPEDLEYGDCAHPEHSQRVHCADACSDFFCGRRTDADPELLRRHFPRGKCLIRVNVAGHVNDANEDHLLCICHPNVNAPELYEAWLPFWPFRGVYCKNCGRISLAVGWLLARIWHSFVWPLWGGQAVVDPTRKWYRRRAFLRGW